MKKISLLILTLILSLGSARATDYYLFYFGGQSNMDGFGTVEELPDSLNKEFRDVRIFHGNPTMDNSGNMPKGLWSTLVPGHGFGFGSDGTKNYYSKKFGCELSFAKRMLELHPGKKIAILKYSKDGSSLDSAAGKYGCWDPDYTGINQYDHFLSVLKMAMSVKDIDGDGTEDKLIPSGILWMQGESDGYYTIEIANNYLDHLKELISVIRFRFSNDSLPVIIGQISDSHKGLNGGPTWKHGEIIMNAQRIFVEQDGHAILFDGTKAYSYFDKFHYNGAGFIDMGNRFAEEISGLWSNKN